MADKKTKTKEEKLEREYTIPLRRQWSKTQSYKRVPKSIKAIKEFLVRHMKIYDRDLKKVKINQFLNEELWFRGIKNPPSKIKVKATKEKNKDGEEIVNVELFELPKELKFKKARQEKQSQKAEEISKKRLEASSPNGMTSKDGSLKVQGSGSKKSEVDALAQQAKAAGLKVEKQGEEKPAERLGASPKLRSSGRKEPKVEKPKTPKKLDKNEEKK